MIDREQIVRQMISHENEMTNHRLSWLNAIQGLLFAALAFAWEKDTTGLLVYAFALIGGLVCVSSYIGLYCSHEAVQDLKKTWDENKRTWGTSGLDVVGYYRGIIGVFGPWQTLPIVFALGWIAVALIWFYR